MKANPVIRRQHDEYARVVTALFEMYRTPISVYLYRVVDDWELAHDLTQETFLRAFRAREQFLQVKNQLELIFPTLPLPEERYHFVIGMYDPDTGMRLPVQQDGTIQPNGQVTLMEIN